jgi:hypothetical protein
LNVCEIAERPILFVDRPEIITQPPVITVAAKAFFDIGLARRPLKPENRSWGQGCMGDSSGE